VRGHAEYSADLKGKGGAAGVALATAVALALATAVAVPTGGVPVRTLLLEQPPSPTSPIANSNPQAPPSQSHLPHHETAQRLMSGFRFWTSLAGTRRVLLRRRLL